MPIEASAIGNEEQSIVVKACRLTDWKAEIPADMAEWCIRNDGTIDVGREFSENFRNELMVVAVCELAKNEACELLKQTCIAKMCKVAVDFVRWFIDVFDSEDDSVKRRKVIGSDE